MVPVSTINTENGKVSCETPDGTVINININQRSALDCLLDTIRALRIKAKSPTQTKPTRGTAHGTSLWLGATLISLGCVCVMLAVILCVVQPSLAIYFTGAHFWVGFPLIVSGALSVVSYRYPKACWEVIAFIGLLASLGVSIAGLVISVDDAGYHYDVMNSVCDNLRNGRNGYGGYDYRATRPPRDYEYNWDLDRCKQGQRQLQSLLTGLGVMTLLLMIWGICISVIGLGCRLKTLCSGCTCEKPAEEKDDPLLSADPTGEILTV
ncbi:transmembrane protein 176A-like [Pseudophryne corroboree]|uniref:transmembrane protein 176A-like n=1 Tax=Pseudophryne corroboree TaxID=495146 RepID=UPI003081CA6D